MLTTILLSGLCGVALTVVLWVCIKWHKRNQGNPPGETITDSMVCKMLKEKKCNILEDPGNPEWILFEFEGNHYFIRMCGNYCELFTQSTTFRNQCTIVLINTQTKVVDFFHFFEQNPIATEVLVNLDENEVRDINNNIARYIILDNYRNYNTVFDICF